MEKEKDHAKRTHWNCLCVQVAVRLKKVLLYTRRPLYCHDQADNIDEGYPDWRDRYLVCVS